MQFSLSIDIKPLRNGKQSISRFVLILSELTYLLTYLHLLPVTELLTEQYKTVSDENEPKRHPQ